MWKLFENPIVREYRRYRQAGIKLAKKITDACWNEDILWETGKVLGMGDKRPVIIEEELDIFIDCSLYEIRDHEGKNCIQRYAETVGGGDPLEQRLLPSMAAAKQGLFQIRQTLPRQRQLILDNLIQPDAPVILTDIAFSISAQAGVIVFLRPIHLPELTMGSGVFFCFDSRFKQELVHQWQRLETKGEAQRFAWFFKKNRRSGIKTIYLLS